MHRGVASAPSPVGELLVEAIRAKRRVSFVYHRQRRVAEPQCVGVTTADKETLRVYLPRGGKVSEPLFTVSEMSGVVVLDEHFSRPGPNYKKGDSAMKVVFAEL